MKSKDTWATRTDWIAYDRVSDKIEDALLGRICAKRPYLTLVDASAVISKFGLSDYFAVIALERLVRDKKFQIVYMDFRGGSPSPIEITDLINEMRNSESPADAGDFSRFSEVEVRYVPTGETGR